MFGDGVDMESSSGSTHRKKKDPFQKELQKKLKDRRSRGLSADITSPEEESDLSAEDGLSCFNFEPSLEEGLCFYFLMFRLSCIITSNSTNKLFRFHSV